MANGDVTDDDPEMGQDQPPPGGAPPGPPTGGQPPGDSAPMQGGDLAAFARSKMGAQVSAPGPGNQADSMNLIIQAIQTLKQAGLGLQPGSKLHSDVFRTISQLSRHLGGAGGMGPAVGIQKTMIGDQLKRTIQNALLQKIMGGGGQGQPGGGQGGAPMPSTPLPGS
jgi:hypothetical protein|nr:hypothetical protein [Bradyrhizobium sp.]